MMKRISVIAFSTAVVLLMSCLATALAEDLPKPPVVAPPAKPPHDIWIEGEMPFRSNIGNRDSGNAYAGEHGFLMTGVTPGPDGHFADYEFVVRRPGRYLLVLAGGPVGQGHVSPFWWKIEKENAAAEETEWNHAVSLPSTHGKVQWGVSSAVTWLSVAYVDLAKGDHVFKFKVTEHRAIAKDYCYFLDAIALRLVDPLSGTADDVDIRELPSYETLGKEQQAALLPRFKTTSEIAGDSPFGTHLTSVPSEHVGDPKVLLGDVSRAGFKWIKDYSGLSWKKGDGQSLDDALKRVEKPRPEVIQYFKEARKAGLKILMRLDAIYVQGGERDLKDPEFRNGFARYCALMVRHYGRWVQDWEMCNEMNIDDFKPEDYALLCNEAIAAMKAEDADCRVWVGATAMLQCLPSWIQKTLDAGIQGDGYSFHPYCQPYVQENYPERGSQFHPWNHWPDYKAQIADLRGRLDTSKLAKTADGRVPIAGTEAGWPTSVSSGSWVQEISLLTQAKYEQRAMLLDFWLGVRPRINFIFTRGFHNIYHIESKFQLVEPYHSNIMNWSDPSNRDGLFRPAYLAAAAVCSNIDDTLKKKVYRVRLSGVKSLEELNPQIMTFEREHPDLDFVEAVILVWAGVPADDRFQRRSIDISVVAPTEDILCAPFGFSLLPVGAKHSTMDTFNWKVKNLSYYVNPDSLEIRNAPFTDAPYVVKFIRKLR